MSLVRARTPFSVGHFVVAAGDIYESSDPLVRDREALFEPVTPRSTERATAAPGERRSTAPPGAGPRSDSVGAIKAWVDEAPAARAASALAAEQARPRPRAGLVTYLQKLVGD